MSWVWFSLQYHISSPFVPASNQENLSKTPDPDEVDEDEWSDMWTCLENDVRDALSELADKKQLPEKIQILHDFWHRSFYPKFYGEEV